MFGVLTSSRESGLNRTTRSFPDCAQLFADRSTAVSAAELSWVEAHWIAIDVMFHAVKPYCIAGFAHWICPACFELSIIHESNEGCSAREVAQPLSGNCPR